MDIDKRDCQPLLLWACIEDYVRRHEELPPAKLHAYVFRADKPGAFLLRGPKLYYDEDLSDGYWANCEQSALWDEREHLGEVVLAGLGGGGRETRILGRTLADALEALRGD